MSTTCTLCPSQCIECISLTECSLCKSGFFLHISTCGSTCPAHFFKNSTSNACEMCDAICHECKDNFPTNCTSCSAGRFHFKALDQCLLECPQGFFEDFSNNNCSSCNVLCEDCSGPADYHCIACREGKFLHLNQENGFSSCLNGCPAGLFGNFSSRMCQACTAACMECSGPSETECTKCGNGRFYYLSQCLTQCPDGFYADSYDADCKVIFDGY